MTGQKTEHDHLEGILEIKGSQGTNTLCFVLVVMQKDEMPVGNVQVSGKKADLVARVEAFFA